MGDLVFIALTIAFFSLAYAYIAACARVVGPALSPAEAPIDAERRPQVPA